VRMSAVLVDLQDSYTCVCTVTSVPRFDSSPSSDRVEERKQNLLEGRQRQETRTDNGRSVKEAK